MALLHVVVIVYVDYYWKYGKQSLDIYNVRSMFQILLSGVPQGSIRRPLNELLNYIKDVELLNLADGNIILTFSKSVDDLITELQK